MASNASSMPSTSHNTDTTPIPHLRWWICGMLFAVSAVNYIDRQTLSALAPILKDQYHWSNTDYSNLLNWFRISYMVMQSVFGWMLDWLGTGRGMSISVFFYSIVTMLTAAARGLFSFSVFRFFLAAGQSANNPGGSKAISEWFPAKERAWAVAFFNSGCSIGGALAPVIAFFIYRRFGDWRPVFLFTGLIGFVWLAAWHRLYRTPERHNRLSAAERAYIEKGRSSGPSKTGEPPVRLLKLLKYRQTWGLVLGRFLLDPYWFFMSEWFAVYLKSKGFSLGQSMLGFWAPFLGGLLGNYFSGGLSSYLIRRGWPVGRSRRTILGVFGPSMLLLIFAAYSDSYYVLLLLFAYTTFAYSSCGTMFLTLPTDVFHTRAVGTVMGLSGTGAGIGTILFTRFTGEMSERFGFFPVIVVASILPCLATVVFLTLVRAAKKPDPDGVLLTF